MIIAINAYSARRGGGVTYLKNLIKTINEESNISILLYCSKEIDLPPKKNLTRLYAPFPVENPLLRAIWEYLFLPFSLLKHKVDVFFCPGGLINTVPLHPCKKVTMFRNMLPFNESEVNEQKSFISRARNKILRKKMLSSMRSADKVIFISDHAREFIERKIPIKKAATIKHGINEIFRNPPNENSQPKIKIPKKYILYVSRFESYKRHLEVVKAYELLKSDLKENHALVFAGAHDYPDGRTVIKYIEEKKLTDNVFLLGEHPYEQLPQLYHGAEVVIFASVCENCPNILLEALASGSAILCSDVMPMPEFGADAVEYVNVDSPMEISKNIERMLREKGAIEELRNRAKKESLKYSWENTGKKTWEELINL